MTRTAADGLAEDITLQGAAGRLGYVPGEDFDRRVMPVDLVQPGATLGG